jgi:hypothetical protein
MGEGGDKGEWWMEWIQVCYIWCIVRTFENATMQYIVYCICTTITKSKKKKGSSQIFWFYIMVS